MYIFFFPFVIRASRGHQEILRGEGKCLQYDPAPLVLVKDIMNYMPQMKYMFSTHGQGSSSSSSAAAAAAAHQAKRQRLCQN